MSRADHVVAHDGSRRPPNLPPGVADPVTGRFFGFECRNCGAFQAMATPVDVDVYVAAARAYTKSHARCRRVAPIPVTPTPQGVTVPPRE